MSATATARRTVKTSKSAKVIKTKATTKSKTEKAPRAKAAPKLFTGKVEATTVYRRKMGEFKNCEAYCWLLVNKINQTHTTANSYNGNTPKESYDPATYTYATKNPTFIERKVEQDKYEELEDVTSWPDWVQNAHATKGKRKAK